MNKLINKYALLTLGFFSLLVLINKYTRNRAAKSGSSPTAKPIV